MLEDSMPILLCLYFLNILKHGIYSYLHSHKRFSLAFTIILYRNNISYTKYSMAKDFALLAEASKSIYEAGEVTGVVAAPAVGAPTQSTAATPAQTQQAGASTTTKLQAKDSTKLIKNLNDIYLKTRENTDILTRNNVPGAKEQFNTQKTLMGQTIAK